ncbi:contractile injection system tape measure protein [Pedobacter sp. NJ-S-72]
MRLFKNLMKSPFTVFNGNGITVFKAGDVDAGTTAISPAGALVNIESKNKTTSNQTVTIANILHYFIQYGAMPWWGKVYSHHSPEMLLKMLFDSSVSETLIILEKAGKQPESRKRFLWQFSDDLTYQIFSYLPDWNFVTIATEIIIIELIEGIAAFAQITQLSLKDIILEAVWLSYLEMKYEAFNETCFYLNVFKSLSRYSKMTPQRLEQLFSGVINSAKKEVTEFQKMRSFYSWSKAKGTPLIFGTDDKKDHRDSILYQVELTIALFNSEKHAGRISVSQNSVAQTWTTISPYETLDSFLLQEQKQPLDLKQRQQKAIHLLEYYLFWNRLPENTPVLNHKELDNLLTELLLLLYLENREALMRILKSEKHSVNARMKVHRLFLPDYKGGDHKQLSLLLDDYIEKDALQYVQEISGNGGITGNPELKPALDRLLEKARTGNTEEQLKLLLKSSPLTRYVALHYGDETMEWLIEKRSGSDQTFKQQTALVRKLILSVATNTHDYQKLKILLNEAALFYLSGLVQAKNISSYISFTFRYLAGSFYTAASANFFTVLRDKIHTTTNLAPVYKDVIPPVKHELEYQLKLQEREIFLKRKAEEERKILDIATKDAEQKLILESLKREEEAQKKLTRLLKKGDKLYVGNAGLVLLHPFLSTYFTRLNLMEKGQFVSLEAKARAVHLLQYLAFKTTENPEHELVLNKILCNYPIQEPLPLEILISDEEISLSAELLQVVIERAGKLSSSSADGFSVSFLQRDGALTETPEEWTLRVDQRGYDLILQTLPWAFGMIKFQWMDKPIIIEWI